MKTGLIVSVFLLSLSISQIVLSDNVKIDGSSIDAFYKSSILATEGMSEDNQNTYIKAAELIATSSLTLQETLAFSVKSLTKEQLQAEKIKSFDGMTVFEVVTKAKDIAKQFVHESGGTAHDVETLSKIEITEVTSSKLKDRTFGEKIEIKFKVKNSTDKAISRLDFLAIAKSDDRQTPWYVDESLTVKVRGGIEPSESMNLMVEPNPFSWPIKEIPKDAKITLSLHSAYGADGVLLWSMNEKNSPLSNDEAAELERLIPKFEEFLKQAL